MLTTLLVVIVGLNFLPVRAYGETEFYFAISKVLMMIGLLFLSFILFWGGGPKQNGILGFHYWKDPGAVGSYLGPTVSAKHATAFFSCLILSAFPFTFSVRKTSSSIIFVV